MGEELPKVARMDAGSLIEAVHAHTDLRLTLVARLPGGEVGAALVTLSSGEPAVLTSWPGDLGARAPLVAEIIGRLRARGYPAPAYLAIVDCPGITAVLQERVDGEPVGPVGVGLVTSLLELNQLQRSALPDTGGTVADLFLDRDGPGYCLHGSLGQHGPGTRRLLDRVHEVARAVPQHCVAGNDAVHGDFHPGNVLVAAGRPEHVAGVVDWTGAGAGHCGLDLVTLGFTLEHDGAPVEVCSLVRERLLADVGPDPLLAFTAHMALRQVDWAIRHHGPVATERWLRVADGWLTWAERPG